MISRVFEACQPAVEHLIHSSAPMASRLATSVAFARHDLNRTVVEPLRWRALGALPRSVVYWVLLEAGRQHCGGPNHPSEVVPEVAFVTVLERLSNGRRALRLRDGSIMVSGRDPL